MEKLESLRVGVVDPQSDGSERFRWARHGAGGLQNSAREISVLGSGSSSRVSDRSDELALRVECGAPDCLYPAVSLLFAGQHPSRLKRGTRISDADIGLECCRTESLRRDDELFGGRCRSGGEPSVGDGDYLVLMGKIATETQHDVLIRLEGRIGGRQGAGSDGPTGGH